MSFMQHADDDNAREFEALAAENARLRAQRDALLHVLECGNRHSMTSCPPGSRAMCSYKEIIEQATGPERDLPQVSPDRYVPLSEVLDVLRRTQSALLYDGVGWDDSELRPDVVVEQWFAGRP